MLSGSFRKLYFILKYYRAVRKMRLSVKYTGGNNTNFKQKLVLPE